MRLLCAWCEKKEKPALIAAVEPREHPTPVHGMFPAPGLRLRAQPGGGLRSDEGPPA